MTGRGRVIVPGDPEWSFSLLQKNYEDKDLVCAKCGDPVRRSDHRWFYQWGMWLHHCRDLGPKEGKHIAVHHKVYEESEGRGI